MKKNKKVDVLIVGSGAGGGVLAYELTKKKKDVLIIEKGSIFNQDCAGNFWQVVFKYYEKYALRRSQEGVTIYGTSNIGGTTVVSCGNMTRSLENEFCKLGIDLSKEFVEAELDLQVAPLSEKKIVNGSRAIMEAAARLDYNMSPMPKGSHKGSACNMCGECVAGCKRGWKWDVREYINLAVEFGAEVLHSTKVKEVLFSTNKEVVGVRVWGPNGVRVIEANRVVLSAGGIGTPIILQNSNISSGHGLFIDPFEVTYGTNRYLNQLISPSMATVCTEFYELDKFILAPYVDHWPQILLFNKIPRSLSYAFSRLNTLSIMTKIADSRSGRVYQNGKISKALTKRDRHRLKQGAEVSKKILMEAGVDFTTIATSNNSVRGAHPGGTAAVGEVVDSDLKVYGCEGLYVCDCSVFPTAPGLPPILTITALAKRLAKSL